MTFPILILFLLLSGIFYAFNCRRFSRIICGAVVVLILAIGSGIVPKILLDHLQSPYASQTNLSWKHQNAIVMLGFGTERVTGTQSVEIGMFGYGRLTKTLEVYRDCKKSGNQCTVILSGGDARHRGVSEAAVYSAYLRNLGIENTDLILESKSMNTWQNAQFTGAILHKQTYDSIVLVTSGVHLTRSLLYFQQAGVRAIPVRADYVSVMSSWMPISYNFLVTDLALHEYIGILRNMVYNMLGWNSAVTKPGSL